MIGVFLQLGPLGNVARRGARLSWLSFRGAWWRPETESVPGWVHGCDGAKLVLSATGREWRVKPTQALTRRVFWRGVLEGCPLRNG